MLINQYFLDSLSAQAKANPRLRQAYDLRNTPEDNSQRMLNALEPGTVMPIHRHRTSSESITIIRGKMIMRFYDDKDNLADEVIMEPNGESPMVQVGKGQWHSLEVLEEGTVIFEAKDGKYEPLAEEDIITYLHIIWQLIVNGVSFEKLQKMRRRQDGMPIQAFIEQDLMNIWKSSSRGKRGFMTKPSVSIMVRVIASGQITDATNLCS